MRSHRCGGSLTYLNITMQTTMHARPLQAAQPSAMPLAARRMGCGGLPPRRCQMPQTDAQVPLQPRSRDARHRLILARAAGPPGFGPIGEDHASALPPRMATSQAQA